MNDYEKIVSEIEKLEPIVQEKIEKFEKDWFEDINKVGLPFNEYLSARIDFLGKEGKLLTTLYESERMQRPIELSELPEYGDVMPLDDFIENVKVGNFIDYDGFGYYVQDGKETNVEIYPSDIEKGLVREGFDTMIWFNK